MTKANTTVIAKLAAAFAVAALAVSMFAVGAQAQTTTTTTTTTASTCASFNRDLTIGATGPDVTTLQNWLISKGFVIPAGATGYFGGQTQAALAKYQASVGISPAAGYFGPITRAQVNGVVCAGGNNNGGNNGGGTDDDDDDDNDDDDNDNDGDLSGGEADLSDFEFNRENNSGDEGEEEVEIATAEFDVEDGDVRVERFELIASSTGTGSASDRPWDYFDTLYLWADGDEVAEVDASDRDEWDEEDDNVYRISFEDLDYIVDEENRAEITVVGDISTNLDAADIATGEFTFYVEDEGIRAVDSEGIDHYIGEDDGTEEVEFTFGEEEDGELNVETSDEDPDAMTLIGEDDESDEYMVFAFELDNQEDADVLVTELTIDVNTISTTTTAEDLLSDAVLTIDGEEYDGDIDGDVITFDDIDLEIAGDESVSAELTITLRADAAEDGNVQLTFSVGTVEAEGVDSGDDAEVDGDATSETHTIADEGIMVTAEEDESEARNEAESSVSDSGVGTFRITFEVSAIEEDIYIYRGAAQGDNDATPFSGVASTTGVVYNVYQGSNASSTVVSNGSLSGTADQEGQFYVIESGESETFTLTVTVDTPVAGSYFAELDAVRFDTNNDGSTADDELYTVPDESEFESETESLY